MSSETAGIACGSISQKPHKIKALSMHAFPGGTINRKEVGTGEGVGTEKVLECSHWSVYVYIYIYIWMEI